MPSAAAFIGGGLLQGVGKGIATQGAEERTASAAVAVQVGKDKRARALADLEHQRGIERDERAVGSINADNYGIGLPLSLAPVAAFQFSPAGRSWRSRSSA